MYEICSICAPERVPTTVETEISNKNNFLSKIQLDKSEEEVLQPSKCNTYPSHHPIWKERSNFCPSI